MLRRTASSTTADTGPDLTMNCQYDCGSVSGRITYAYMTWQSQLDLVRLVAGSGFGIAVEAKSWVRTRVSAVLNLRETVV